MTSDGSTPKSGWGGPLIEESDILGSLGDRRGTALFLGRFTLAEVEALLAKKGLIKEARRRGLWPLAFDLDSSEYPTQRFQIFLGDRDPERVIVDLKVRTGVFSSRGRAIAPSPLADFTCLVLEWLTLQNPAEGFSEKRGALPGQRHPGLGMSKRIMDIFTYLAKILGKEAILAFPAYYHNAVLFSRYFKFVSPEKEAEVQAIRKTFLHVPIKQMAWIVHLDCLRTADGGTYEWTAEEQVCPLGREVRDHFESRAYRDRVRECLERHRFSIDWEAYERRVQED